MNRPYIFCHMMTSLDGKIMGNYMETPEGAAAGDVFYNISFGKNPYYKHQGWLSGRITTDDNFTFYEKPELNEEAAKVPEGDYIAKKTDMYYVSIDPSGRLGWKSSTLTYIDTTAHVIEVLTEKATNAYKDFLRQRGISYIIAGKDSLDYEQALAKLKEQFGIETLMLGGGAALNWSFIQAGMCDEVSVVRGMIPFSVIISFTMYIRLFTQPLSQIAQVLTSLQPAAAASTRVFEFLGEEELEDESGKTKCLTSVFGNVELDHVRFGYHPDKTIIQDFSVSVKAGQTVAIVGHTGAGKTTIVNLLMRFYETNGGQIRMDGIPIREMKRENVRRLFCMVLQDAWIFEGTLRENLVYCKEGITDDQLDEVCQAVGLTHYVKTLPNGYDTRIGERTSLSTGQRQLITIARAIIADAPLLILDEATSSVDTKTELLVQQAMSTLMEGRTSFVIAHRLSTIRNADLILVMQDGDIVESGNHGELLSRKGIYAELYNSQFEEGA